MSIFWEEETQGLQTTYTTTLAYRLIPVAMLVLLALFFIPLDMNGALLALPFLFLMIWRKILGSLLTKNSQTITYDGKWYRFSEPFRIIVVRKS